MNRIITSLIAFAWLATADPAFAQSGQQNKIHSQTSFDSLQQVVKSLFDVALVFIPAVATIFVVVSGYRYMTAQGNPDQVEKAKKSLTWSVVGFVIALSSVIIIKLVADTVAPGLDTGFKGVGML